MENAHAVQNQNRAVAPIKKTPSQNEHSADKRTLVKDIAAAAGVSKATVSKALNGYSNISDRTKRRIKELAEEMGYTPDPALNALAAYRRKNTTASYQANIALITTAETSQTISQSPITSSLSLLNRYLVREFKRMGYKLDVEAIGNQRQAYRHSSDILYNRGVKGLLFLPSEHPLSSFPFQWKHFTSVSVFHHEPKPLMPAVGVNPFSLAQRIAQQLYERGYRKPGLILPTPLRLCSTWQTHFQDCWARFKTGKALPHLIATSNHDSQMLRTFASWIRKSKPDVLVCHGSAASITRLLSESNIRVPEDLSLVSTDIATGEDSLSGCTYSIELLATLTTELMVRLLQQNQVGLMKHPYSIQIDPQWQEGTTLPKLSSLNRPSFSKRFKHLSEWI
ncbi:MAG: LacI family DNA-binding transcriptional regulator [Verrucomicrobiota bacterium]